MCIINFFSKIYIYIITTSLILIAICLTLKILKEIGIVKLNLLTTLRGKYLSFTSHIKKKFSSLNILKLNDSIRKKLNLFFYFFIIISAMRIFVFLFAFLWSYYNNNNPQNFFQVFKKLWVQWDSSNYLFLSENWYVNEGDYRFYIAFYPLYPFLMKILNLITKNSLLSGVIISNVCILFASYYLYKLVKIDFDEKVSLSAVKYMLIFPFAFYFGIVFTESLFIMLSIIFFYHLRKKNWVLAGFFGFLSSITKNQGILLLAPAIIEIIISLNISDFRYILLHKKALLASFLKKFVWMLFIPTGFGTYLLLNKTITGSWFKFLEYQSNHWHHKFNFLPKTLEYHFYYLTKPDSHMHTISIWGPQLVLIALVIFLMIYGLKKLRGSYLIYTFLYTVVIYSTTWLISGSRYIACLFPVYILIALISQKNKYIDFLLTFVSIIFLGYYTLAFIQGAVI